MTAPDRADAAAIARKLSTRQREVLRAAAAGHLYQSRAIRTLNRYYVDHQRRPVTGTVQILRGHQLLRTGAHDERRRRWETTDLGAAVLAALAGDRGDIDVSGLAAIAFCFAVVLAFLGVFGQWAL